MSYGERSQIDPHTALEETRRIRAQIRRQGRWTGWVWLVIAVATPVFLIGTRADAVGREVQFWIALGFGALAAVLTIADRRRGVVGIEAARVDRPLTVAYAVAVTGVAVVAIAADPAGPPAWFAALCLIPSVPCLVAAWKILRP